MGNNSIGFHATPIEICSFINKMVEEYKLMVVASKISPTFEFKIIEMSNFWDNEAYLCNSRFIILSNQFTKELSNDYNSFLSQNTDNLIIQLGECTGEYMKESTIGTKCKDSEKLKIWKKIIKQFKREMNNGVWAVNPNTKAKCLCKNNYFSVGALTAYKSGVVMKAFAGWNEYHFDE